VITRKRIALMLMLALMLSLVPFNGAFGKSDLKDEHVSVRVLEADPASDLVLDQVSAIIYPDGRVSVRTMGTKKAGTPEIVFDITVDVEAGTYKVELLTPRDELETYDDEASSISSIKPGTYEIQVRLVTRDHLPQYELASTTNRLRWTVYANGTVFRNNHWYVFWTAQPSPIGTYWYTSWSTSYSPWYSAGNTVINTKCEAQYWNNDFLDPNKYTWAWHHVTLSGTNSGVAAWYADWDHWGEFSGLLHGRVFVN